MVLNDGKQQVLGLTKEVLAALEQRGSAAAWVANYLGVSRSGYGDRRPELSGKLGALLNTKHRIRVAGESKQLRCNMMGSTLFGRCLYGSQCHCITDREFAQLQQVMCAAMCDGDGWPRLGCDCWCSGAVHGSPRWSGRSGLSSSGGVNGFRGAG